MVGFKLRNSLILGCAVCLSVLTATFAHSQVPNKQVEFDQNGEPVRKSEMTEKQGRQEWFLSPGRNIARMVEQADGLIKDERYRDAVQLLHQVLDQHEDYFLSPNSKETLRGRVEEMLLNLPPAGRQIYELEYGKEAEYLLKGFHQEQDSSKLAEIMRVYRATDAGLEASLIVLDRSFDRGDYMAASGLGTDLLKRRMMNEQQRQSVLWQTAISRTHYKDYANANQLLEQLRSVTSPDEFARKLKEIPAKWSNQTSAVSPPGSGSKEQEQADVHPVNEWRMPRGTRDRNAGVTTLNSISIDKRIGSLRRTDQFDFETEVDYLLREIRQFSPRNPLDRQISAANPVLTDDLLVTRTLSGLSAFHLPSGKKAWETTFNDLEFDFIVKNSLFAPNVEDDYPETLKRYLIQKSLMNDLTTSTISSDGERVYVIQNNGVLGIQSSAQVPDHPLLSKSYNKLSAYDIKTGKIRWQAGGAHSASKLSLAGVYFLGPPVEWNGEIYVLGEMNQEIRLHAIEPATGKALWSQPLALTASPPEIDLERRMQGLSVSVMDGILICPTGVGVVSALNPTTRQLLWNTYLVDTRNLDAYYGQANLRDPTASRNPYLLYNRMLKQLIEPDWTDYPVVCTPNGILVVSPEDDSLVCLNVDGKTRWKLPRNNYHCVAGVYQDSVLVYSDELFNAIDLQSGKPAWSHPVHIPQPTGQGLRAGSNYYLPVNGHRIWTIDLDRGRLLVETGLPKEISSGHLMIHRDQLALFTPDNLWLFQSIDSVQESLRESLAALPDDAMLWLKQGQLKLQLHDDSGGIAALKKSYELRPDGPAREVLALSLLESLRTDFLNTEPDLALLKRLITDPQMKARLLASTVSGLMDQGRLEEAYQALKEQIDVTGFEDVLLTTENNRSVRMDRWIDKQLSLIAADPRNSFRDRMVSELTSWLHARTSKGDSVKAVFRNLPIPDDTLKSWTKQVLKDPHLDSAALEIHLLGLRQSAGANQAAWATEQYASLIEEWKIVGWEERLAMFINELGGRFARDEVESGMTGAEAYQEWKQNYPALFEDRAQPELSGSPVAESTPTEPNDTSFRIQMTARYPMQVFHGIDSAFVGWDFSINQNRNAIILKDGFHQLQYQLRVPHNMQFTDPRNNFAVTQGSLATVVAGQTVTTFNLMSLSNRAGEPLWSMSLEPPVVSVADVNRVFTEQTANVSPISGSVICTLANHHLTCLDVLTGETLWRYNHLGQGLYYPRIITTDRHVLLCGLSTDDEKVGYLLDIVDGSAIKKLDGSVTEMVMNSLQFGNRFWRFTTKGNPHLAVFELTPDGSVNRILEQGVSERSVFKASYQGIYVMLADSEGLVRVYDLQKCRTVVEDDLSGRFEPSLFEQMEIHEDPDHVYLMLPEKDWDEVSVHGMVTLNSQKFVGKLNCYDVRTGRQKWSHEFPEGQSLDEDQPRDWPFLVLAANVGIPDPQRPTQNQNYRRVTLIDKASGEILKPERNELGSHETLRQYLYRRDSGQFEIFFSRNHSMKVTYPKQPAQNKPIVEDVKPAPGGF